MNKQRQRGFSMVELIIVVAIMAVLAGILAPTLVKYIERARRVRDVDTAKEIRLSIERLIIDSDPGTSVSGPGWNYTSAVMWNKDTPLPTTSQSFVDSMFMEFGRVPISSTDKNYFWVVEYDIRTAHVTKIYLTPSPGSAEQHELYPNADDFLAGN